MNTTKFFKYNILKHYMKIDAQVGKFERSLELPPEDSELWTFVHDTKVIGL